MNDWNVPRPGSHSPLSRRTAALLGICAASALVSACGGGGDYTPSVPPPPVVVDEFAMVVNQQSGAIMRKGDTLMY